MEYKLKPILLYVECKSYAYDATDHDKGNYEFTKAIYISQRVMVKFLSSESIGSLASDSGH